MNTYRDIHSYPDVMGVLFFAEIYDLYTHIYHAPHKASLYRADVLPRTPSFCRRICSHLGKGCGAPSLLPGTPRAPLISPGAFPALQGGCAGPVAHPRRPRRGAAPPSRPRRAPPGVRGAVRADSGGSGGCAPRGANSRLRTANGEGRPRWHQISRSQLAGEAKGKKMQKKKRKKAARHHERAWPSPSSSSSASFLPPPGPPRLPSRVR